MHLSNYSENMTLVIFNPDYGPDSGCTIFLLIQYFTIFSVLHTVGIVDFHSTAICCFQRHYTIHCMFHLNTSHSTFVNSHDDEVSFFPNCSFANISGMNTGYPKLFIGLYRLVKQF